MLLNKMNKEETVLKRNRKRNSSERARNIGEPGREAGKLEHAKNLQRVDEQSEETYNN